MSRRLILVLAAVAALASSGIAYGQPTNTPTPARTPTPTPTSNRWIDLSMAKAASPATVAVGQDLTYTLTVRNNGPNAATFGLEMADTLPADVTFVSASIETSAFGPGSCNHSSGTVRCYTPGLGVGDSRRAFIVVKPATAGRITNSAAASVTAGGLGGNRDPDLSNNTATASTDVVTFVAFMHGSGAVANPPALFLDGTAPTATVAKYRDSAAVRAGLTNPWVDVGAWPAQPALFAGTLDALADLSVWLGLKNGDDEGTQFDLRAEVWKNGVELVASGEKPCVRGVTRNPDRAKEVAVAFDLFSPVDFDGTADTLSVKVLARIGTKCSGPSHSSATGVRLYFDSLQRPSGLGTRPQP